MIYLKKTAILLAALLPVSLFAQTAGTQAVKVLTVRLQDVYSGYYKTAEANQQLKAQQTKAQNEMKGLQDQYKKLVDQFKEMRDQSQNTALTKEARDKAKGDAENKAKEIQSKQEEISQTGQNLQRQIEQLNENHMQLAFEDIKNAAAQVAQAHGATLVLDVQGPSGFGTSPILYSDSTYDVTSEVLAILNKNAPKTPAASSSKDSDKDSDASSSSGSN